MAIFVYGILEFSKISHWNSCGKTTRRAVTWQAPLSPKMILHGPRAHQCTAAQPISRRGTRTKNCCRHQNLPVGTCPGTTIRKKKKKEKNALVEHGVTSGSMFSGDCATSGPRPQNLMREWSSRLGLGYYVTWFGFDSQAKKQRKRTSRTEGIWKKKDGRTQFLKKDFLPG